MAVPPGVRISQKRSGLAGWAHREVRQASRKPIACGMGAYVT